MTHLSNKSDLLIELHDACRHLSNAEGKVQALDRAMCLIKQELLDAVKHRGDMNHELKRLEKLVESND